MKIIAESLEENLLLQQAKDALGAISICANPKKYEDSFVMSEWRIAFLDEYVQNRESQRVKDMYSLFSLKEKCAILEKIVEENSAAAIECGKDDLNYIFPDIFNKVWEARGPYNVGENGNRVTLRCKQVDA